MNIAESRLENNLFNLESRYSIFHFLKSLNDFHKIIFCYLRHYIGCSLKFTQMAIWYLRMLSSFEYKYNSKMGSFSILFPSRRRLNSNIPTNGTISIYVT